MKRSLSFIALLLAAGTLFCACEEEENDSKALQPIGHPCKSSSECAVGFCYRHTVCKPIDYSGEPTYINGVTCGYDSECDSGYCADKKCADRPGPKLPEKKLPDGKACEENESCESNNCFNNICRPAGWDSDIGSACAAANDCISGICVNKVCVRYTGPKENTYKPGTAASGDACKKHDECASGLCLDGTCSDDCATKGCGRNYFVCRKDKCIPTYQTGNECIQHSDCSIGHYCCNNYCKAGACEPGISCTSENDCKGGCQDSPWGKICGCTIHSDCSAEGYCGSKKSGDPHDNICMPRKINGENCNDVDESCLSGACYRSACIEPRAYGEPCNSAADCISHNCPNFSCGK